MNRPKAASFAQLGDAERIALAYAPERLRSGYRSLLLLDAQLARSALSAREPALAQLKLAWWRDACAQLSPGQGHPVLRALAQSWDAGSGILGGLVDAWEELAVGEVAAPEAEAVANARATAFAALARCPEAAGCLPAARRWTLVSLSARAPDAVTRSAMLAAGAAGGAERLPPSLRPLAVLAGLARRAARRGESQLLGDRLSPFAAMRLGIFGR